MKILLICGVYSEINEKEVMSFAKGYVEQSAVIFQRKLIKGIIKNNYDYKIISAPLIGAYPMRSKKMVFKKFNCANSSFESVSFNNIWGIRNFSRSKSLKIAIKRYLKQEKEDEFLILVYCPHSPFLEAAMFAKKMRPKSKVCLIVPDLPQYMNLNEKNRGLYDFLKKYDIKYMNHYINDVDSFMILTEPMKDVLKIENRPYLVVEGLVDFEDKIASYSPKQHDIKRIVYTGKMNVKFGIKELVDSFMGIDNPNYRLILCGDGDAKSYVLDKAKMDSRIEYKGLVTSLEVKEYINNATILVNPRANNEDYTKYSFPSKNIDYLMTGKPVVAYLLDGMPKIYESFIFTIPSGQKCFADILVKACEDELEKMNFSEYSREYLDASKVVEKVIKMNFK